jgi:outer membrane protein assembly factor BamB
MLKHCLWSGSCFLSAAAILAALLMAFRPEEVVPAEFRAHAYDWPQWQGPERTAISQETGLMRQWPNGGPPLLWKAQGLGGGYSTPSIAGGRIFGMSFQGGNEAVWALEEATGKKLWSARLSRASHQIGYPEGPRCTPTVDGDFLFALGVSGDLACLETVTGKIRWVKNLTEDYSGHMMSGWGYSESPLVDGNKLIATPGGSRATLIALDKRTAETIWRATVPGGEGAGYSSVIAAQMNGQREYIQFLGRGVVGIRAEDGRFLWRYDKPANRTANCSTPISHGNRVFAASGYGAGGGAVDIVREGERESAHEVYSTKSMKNHHGGMVLVNGCIYGSDEGSLCCLDFQSGKVHWENRAPGKGSIAYADGRLYYRNEGGPVVLIEANPDKYVECGRFNQLFRSNHDAWPHPVIANGKLYLRDQEVLLCYDVKAR